MGNKAELVESGGEVEMVLTGFEAQQLEVLLVGDEANVVLMDETKLVESGG